jgi:hypothetical protein
MSSSAERYSDVECERLFADLFPGGFAGKDVLQTIAPEGWAESPLRFVFHPTVQQVYTEAVQFHRNLESFPLRNNKRPRAPEPAFEAVAARYEQTAIDVELELRELVGMCLWDIFSDAHDVVAAGGRIVNIGSFRGAAGFIADQLNRQAGARQYDYLDFYMGTVWVSQRADLKPVYAMIFGRLKDRFLNWRYRFPKIGLVCFHEPSAGERAKIAKLEAELQEGHRKDVENARQHPPPATVQAYRDVYGAFPVGWPPWEFVDDD